jgi:predicted  nucleic acid-binding Zn-ribbon protein
MTTEEDVAHVARQLADLTYAVKDMAGQITALRDRVDNQQEGAAVQQERIDLAARELHEVSGRLQAASKALRESI